MRLRTLDMIAVTTAAVCLVMLGMLVARGAAAPVAPVEDSAGWDCLRMGNVTCRIDGVLVTSLDGMPPVSDMAGRCVWLLRLPGRLMDPEFDPSLCEPVSRNLG